MYLSATTKSIKYELAENINSKNIFWQFKSLINYIKLNMFGISKLNIYLCWVSIGNIITSIDAAYNIYIYNWINQLKVKIPNKR